MGSFTVDPFRGTAEPPPYAPVTRDPSCLTGPRLDASGARLSERSAMPIRACGRRLWHPLKIGLSSMLWLLVAASGCGASDKDALRMRVSELEDRIGVLVRRGDELEGRLSAVEAKKSPVATASVSPAATTGTVPLLQVVKLVPQGAPREDRLDEAAEGSTRDATEADEPRPLIRGSGDRVETTLASGKAPTSVAKPLFKDAKAGHPGSSRGKLPSELSPPAPSGTLP